jgi:LysM repeat protein
VASGENLSSIAVRYGVSLDEILRLNPQIEPNRIMPGEWIDVPQQGGSSR